MNPKRSELLQLGKCLLTGKSTIRIHTKEELLGTCLLANIGQESKFLFKVYRPYFHLQAVKALLKLLIDLGEHKLLITHPNQPIDRQGRSLIIKGVGQNSFFTAVSEVQKGCLQAKANGRKSKGYKSLDLLQHTFLRQRPGTRSCLLEDLEQIFLKIRPIIGTQTHQRCGLTPAHRPHVSFFLDLDPIHIT